MIIVITGNGKGKTTSALGQALRAIGDGRKVLMVQFIKGPWRSGEDNVEIIPKGNPSTRLAKAMAKRASSGLPAFRLVKTGLGFVGILGDKLPREDHAKAAQSGLALAREEMFSGKWDMLILDEVNNAIKLELLKLKDVLSFLDGVPEGMDLILTGRDARQELVDRADIVSEIREIKHIFNHGIKGKMGLEW